MTNSEETINTLVNRLIPIARKYPQKFVEDENREAGYTFCDGVYQYQIEEDDHLYGFTVFKDGKEVLFRWFGWDTPAKDLYIILKNYKYEKEEQEEVRRKQREERKEKEVLKELQKRLKRK